ncbi:ABC transporter ATP-binding protein [Nocardioides solisilvae]|uniref:ABC transporter ATP-binding protein n=1 Tax=Nocardioides solisilvae TaxID=1542435 RepID=UPI000D749E12|nr:ABC transporter ATP-binding protein [Nocardioides solisilvae]
MSTLLEVQGLHAGYGPVEVLRDVSLTVEQGQVAVVLGANGAGKTTLLRALSGIIKGRGRATLDGRQLLGLPSERIAALGVSHVPQGRGTFANMTVEENLRIGAHLSRGDEKAEIGKWYEIFPRLGDRRTQQAGSLSGGEQQMLAVARALMPGPRLLLLDEPSLGLAPNTTRDLFASLGRINAETGTAMLIVEQNAHLALDIGSTAMLLEAGRMVSSGTAQELRDNDDIRRAYLGY